MRKIVWLLVPLIFVFILSADIENPDKPKKGIWDFKLERIWQIERAGEDVFGRPFSLLVSEEGYVYLYDCIILR